MKNKKKRCIIGVSALCIVVAVVLCITLIPKHNGDKPAESETKETSSGTSLTSRKRIHRATKPRI